MGRRADGQMLVDVNAGVESTEIHQMGTLGREGIGERCIALQGGVEIRGVRHLDRERGQERVRLPNPVRKSRRVLKSACGRELDRLSMSTHEKRTSPLRSSIVMVRWPSSTRRAAA